MIYMCVCVCVPIYIGRYTYIQVHIRIRIRTYMGYTTIIIYAQIENSKKRDETLQSRLVLPTGTKGGGCRRSRAPF
jgi:hypothetical protein